MARDQRLVELGLVVGVQVKAGRSFFRRPKRDRDKRIVGWWFEDTRRTHLDLWASYSIPHLLVLHDADAGISYWVHVTRQAVIAAGRGARILVPVDQVPTTPTATACWPWPGRPVRRVPLEGTAWVGALNIPDSDVLRYALIVPRLVAPHPSFADFVLGPFTAITATGTLTDRGLDQQEGITVTNATGALGVLHASMLAASPCTATICGTDGRLDVSGTFYLPTSVTLHDRDGAASDRYDPTGDVAHQGLRYEAAEVVSINRARRRGPGHAGRCSGGCAAGRR
jgi:hypothetical protein